MPFTFDFEKMLEEISLINEKDWIPHFNTNGYKGYWSSIPLYSKGGSTYDIYALSNNDLNYDETLFLSKCDYLREVLSFFKVDFLSVRLLRLSSGAKIYPHKDHELGYEDGVFRLHIPIVTHSGVEFIVDDNRINLNHGECWYINANYTHSVENHSEIDRIHLVIDCKRNNWSDSLFFSLVNEEQMLNRAEIEYDKATKDRIIEELKKMKEPAAKEIIRDLEHSE